jgi:hypothetical protein
MGMLELSRLPQSFLSQHVRASGLVSNDRLWQMHDEVVRAEKQARLADKSEKKSESEMADGKNRGEETQGEWRLFGIARNTMRPPQDYPQPPLLFFLPAKPFFLIFFSRFGAGDSISSLWAA